jgi:hypothetical protein
LGGKVKWIVSTSKESVELTEIELLDVLFTKLLKDSKDSQREDFDVLTKTFSDFMQAREALTSTTIEQLVCMGLSLGYFYRVFLEKNEVQKIGEKSEKPDEPICDTTD